MRWPFTKQPEAGTSDVEVIKAKLAQCQADIEAAEADLRRVSVSAVLGDDPGTARDAVTRLRDLRAHHELLQTALQAALDAEAHARAVAEARQHAAQVRSLQQHLGRLDREAADLSTALANAQDHYTRLLDAAESTRAALLPSMAAAGIPNLLLPAHVQRLTRIELHRVSQHDPARIMERPPGLGEFERPSDGRITPLCETVAGIVGNIRARLKTPPPKTQAPQPAPTQPVSSAQASVDALSSSTPADVASRALGSRGEVVDLRGKDLGVVKEPESEESMEVEHV
jgi:hypothetical protein